MDQVDHVAHRMTLAALSGLFVGCSIATYRGSNILKTAFSVSGSYALCGTACFGSERIVYNALKMSIKPENSFVQLYGLDEQTKQIWWSHSLGGAVGGMICGGIYQGRPIAGIFLFTPLMLIVACGELALIDYREKRLAEIRKESSERAHHTN
jgi:hypothetical protein